jgi:hypothetical protein
MSTAELNPGKTGILWAVPVRPLKFDPRFPVEAAHIHCTLARGVREEDYAELIGVRFMGVVMGRVHNTSIEALQLMLPCDVACTNRIPHITLSMAEGVQPSESNSMLAGPAETSDWSGLSCIEFEIEFFAWEGQQT